MKCRASAAAVAEEAAVDKQAPAPAPANKAVAAESKGFDHWNDTYYPKGVDTAAVNKDWYIIDAEGQTLGRLAVVVAHFVRGKHLPSFHPACDMGSFVVVINAEKVVVTGNKFNDKLYKRHTTGRPGSMKVERFKDLQARIPERIIEKAVKGMLTRGRLGNKLFHHMKVYKGPDHPHTAQKPVDITSLISGRTAGKVYAKATPNIDETKVAE